MRSWLSYVCALIAALCLTGPGVAGAKKKRKGVPPAKIEAGVVCELSRVMRMGSKPKGRGKRIKVAKGDQVEVVEVNRGWVTVSAEEKKAFTKRKNLARACAIVEQEVEPEAPEPEPEEPELAAIDAPEEPAEEPELAPPPAPPSEPTEESQDDEPGVVPDSTPPPPSTEGGGITNLLSAIQAPGTLPTFQPTQEVRRTRTRKKEKKNRTPLYVAGVGLASAGIGATLLALGKTKGNTLRDDIIAYNQSPVRAGADERSLQSRRDQVATFDVTSVAMLGVGGAALGVGFIMWLARDDDKASSSRRFSNLGVSPTVGTEGEAGILVRGDF